MHYVQASMNKDGSANGYVDSNFNIFMIYHTCPKQRLPNQQYSFTNVIVNISVNN